MIITFKLKSPLHIVDESKTRNAMRKQVIYLFSEIRHERSQKLVSRCGAEGKILKESHNMAEVTCKKCKLGKVGRHLITEQGV